MVAHRTKSPYRWTVGPSLTYERESFPSLHSFHPRIVNGSGAGSWEKTKCPSQIWALYAQKDRFRAGDIITQP